MWWHWRVMQNLKKNLLVVAKMTWEIWLIFAWPLKCLKIRTLMASLFPKQKEWVKKLEELCVMKLNSDAKFPEEPTCCCIITWKIWRIFTWPPESLKICTLLEYLCPKCIKDESKNYRRVICHDTEKRYQIWRTYLPLQTWYEEFGTFSCQHWKVLKLELWWVPSFVQSILMYELNNYSEVLCSNTKEWCKIWSRMKNDEEIFEFWPEPLK